MHVGNHFPSHLHTALTMLREHAMSEQRVSVETGVRYYRVIREHRDVVNILNICPETQMAKVSLTFFPTAVPPCRR